MSHNGTHVANFQALGLAHGGISQEALISVDAFPNRGALLRRALSGLAVARGGACANGASCLNGIAEYRLYGFHGALFVISARACDANCPQCMAVLDDWNAARLWKITEPNGFGITLFHLIHELAGCTAPARGRHRFELGCLRCRG